MSSAMPVQYRDNIPTVDMPFTIYKTEVSAPSRAVLMVAKLLDLSCITEEVNCVTKKMRPEIKNNTIPVLQDRDLFIADSHVIITYLTSKYGGDRREQLYPSDLVLRAIVDQRLYFEATKLSPTCKDIVVAILHEKCSKPSEKQIDEVDERYGTLESYLEETKFVAGDHLTVADVSIVSTVAVMASLVPIDEGYEKLKAWFTILREQDWYKENYHGLNEQINILKDAMKKNRG